MKKLLAITAVLSGNALASTQTVEVVGPNVCQDRGFNMARCSYEPHDVSATVDLPYIPRVTKVSVRHEGDCSTHYPVSIAVGLGNGVDELINALASGEHVIPQDGSSLIKVNVVSPWSQYAYYYSSCRIVADVQTDVVDEGDLTSILSRLATDASKRIDVIQDQIHDKSTIQSLLGVASKLEAIIDIAEKDSASVYELNTTLQENCDSISPCTWIDQIGVVLNDPNVELPDSQLLLLFSLAFDLDTIVPADCTDNNCVAELVDEETTSAIRAIRAGVDANGNGDHIDDIPEQIKLLLDEKLTLESHIEELKGVASRYGISWSSVEN